MKILANIKMKYIHFIRIITFSIIGYIAFYNFYSCVGIQPSRNLNESNKQELLDNAIVVTYPGVANIKSSTDYEIEVNRKSVFVYNAKVYNGETACFAYFDFAGTVNIKVETKQIVDHVIIRPLSSGITPEVNGNSISFYISQSRNLTLEINGSIERALHIFANPLEENPPRIDDPNVIYFGPGIHEISTIRVPDNTIVYIAGGAIIKGIILPDEEPNHMTWAGQKQYGSLFQFNDVSNVRICGRGIIDTSELPWHAKFPILLSNCSDFKIDGIILNDSPIWNVFIDNSHNGIVSNIKIIGHRENSDGIDIVDSHEVVVQDCFLRTNDDIICVKSIDSDIDAGSSNILVKDCVIWNERASGLGVTYETRSNISNIVFRNCDIIHDFSNEHHCAALSVSVCDSGTVSNIQFEDIRIEHSREVFIHCWIGRDMWSTDEERGHIKGVLFRNISYTGDESPLIKLTGFSSENLVKDVIFDNLNFQGEIVDSIDNNRFNINFTRNIQFINNDVPMSGELEIIETEAVDNTCINLSWTEVSVSDSIVQLYHIYRNGEKINESCINHYADTDVQENTRYSYYISTNTEGVMEKLISNEVYITTPYDQIPPNVLYASTLKTDSTQMRVYFDKSIDKQSAEQLTNYYISDNTIQVESVTLGEDQTTVILTVNKPIIESIHMLTIKNVKDQTIKGNIIESNSTCRIYLNTPGLIGYWKFNEGTGTAVMDTSGYNVHGVLIGEPTWTDGIDGYGLQFNPSGGFDYVEIINSLSLDKVQESNYTICAWFMPLDIPSKEGSDDYNAYGIVMKEGYHIGLSFSQDKQFIINHYLDGDIWAGAVTINNYDPGQFYHITGIVNRSEGVTKIYVDGELKSQNYFPVNANTRDFGQTPWRIGIANPNASEYPFPAYGVVDNVQIFELALTDEQIKMIMNEYTSVLHKDE